MYAKNLNCYYSTRTMLTKLSKILFAILTTCTKFQNLTCIFSPQKNQYKLSTLTRSLYTLKLPAILQI